MARKPDVQYIRFVTDGSAARVAEVARPRPKTRLPKIRKAKDPVIRVDPLAFLGIALSVVMLVLMVVSCFQLQDYQQKANVMDDYVDSLKEHNAYLSDTYQKGYDLKDIEEKALALGMIPVEQAQRITVSVEIPEQKPSEDGSSWSMLTDLLP